MHGLTTGRRRMAWSLPAMLFALLLALAAGAAIAEPSLAAPSWTVMLYLDGENGDMQNDILTEFETMIAAGVGSTADVNVVAQLDRIPGSSRFGGWTETNRFYVTAGMEPTRTNAIADWGDGQGGREVDMSAGATLNDYVAWAVAGYPADRYALVILDHGYGWKGLCIDETSLGSTMPVKQLAAALQGLPVQIDLLALDACLMQSAEVGYELRSCDVGTVVGSEAPGLTWPLTQIIAAMEAEPSIATETLAARICDLYFAAHPAEGAITLSAYRLNGMTDLAAAVKALAEELATPPHDATPARAADVITALEDAVFYSRAGSQLAGTRGLSIYYPGWTGQYHESIPSDFSYFYQAAITSFCIDAGWRGLLWRYYTFYPDLDDRIRRALSSVLTIEDTADLDHLCREILSTAPSTTVSGRDDAWHNTPVTVRLTATTPENALPVAYTEYRVNGGIWTRGTSVTIPAPRDHSWDGIHMIGYRSADSSTPAHVEDEQTCNVKIDTVRPATIALANVTAKKGRRFSLRYRVNDALPTGQTLSPYAQVRIVVRTLRGRVVKRWSLGKRATNTPRRWNLRCTLDRGKYRFFVYATDLAGNSQGKVGHARLTVK